MVWTNIKSALVSGVLMAILGISVYIIGKGDIFGLDFHTLANIGVLSVLTAIVSEIKSILTTPAGNFVGIVEIK